MCKMPFVFGNIEENNHKMSYIANIEDVTSNIEVLLDGDIIQMDLNNNNFPLNKSILQKLDDQGVLDTEYARPDIDCFSECGEKG